MQLALPEFHLSSLAAGEEVAASLALLLTGAAPPQSVYAPHAVTTAQPGAGAPAMLPGLLPAAPDPDSLASLSSTHTARGPASMLAGALQDSSMCGGHAPSVPPTAPGDRSAPPSYSGGRVQGGGAGVGRQGAWDSVNSRRPSDLTQALSISTGLTRGDGTTPLQRGYSRLSYLAGSSLVNVEPGAASFPQSSDAGLGQGSGVAVATGAGNDVAVGSSCAAAVAQLVPSQRFAALSSPLLQAAREAASVSGTHDTASAAATDINQATRSQEQLHDAGKAGGGSKVSGWQCRLALADPACCAMACMLDRMVAPELC